MISSLNRSGICSTMMANSSKVAGIATYLTGALPAPLIFGGARAISSSSTAACKIERNNLKAAALVEAVAGSSDARQILICPKVTSLKVIWAKKGKIRELRRDS